MFEELKYNLKHNRKHVMRYVTAWMLFGAIIVVFIFWGMSPRTQGQGMTQEGGGAAMVNDTTISLAQFGEARERMRRDPRYAQLQELGGDAGRQMIDRQALEQLVEMELIHQAIDRQKMFTSNAEVVEVLSSIPAFQEEGRFKPAIYRNYLDQVRKTPGEFEEEVRNERSTNRMFKMFTTALKPLKLENSRVEELSNMKANLDYVSVPSDALVTPESIAAADVKTYLALPDSEAKIKDYFATHKGDFSTPERVKARHILVRAKAGDAEDEKRALAKIEDIAKKAKTGDFAQLATQYSEDPGSKSKGGLLDFFSRGKMVPAFEQAAFSQPLNVVGAPVKTDYGYHLIQVLEKKPALNRTQDEVKDEIAEILIAKDRSHAAVEVLQEALKKSDASAIQKFVTDHKLKWEETGTFSIESENVPKLGPNEELVKVAFQLTPEKPFSDSLIREGGRSLIVRYKAPQADKDPKKSESPALKQEMQEMMAGRRTEDVIRKWLDDLRKESKVSTNPDLFGRRSDS